MGGRSVPSNLVIDETGTDHILGSSVAPHHGRVRYYFRKPNTEGFHHTTVDYSPGHHATSTLALGSTGNTIAAVFSDCSGIRTVRAPIRAHKLPKPTVSVPGRGCDEDDGPAVHLDGVVELQHSLVAVLVTDDGESQPPSGLAPGLQVWKGKPGTRFSLEAQQPTAASDSVTSGAARFAFFRRDRLLHQLEIITSSAAPGGLTLSVSTALPGRAWSDPTDIITLPRSDTGNRDYGLADAVANGGDLDIAVQPTVADPDRPKRSIRGQYLLVQRTGATPATTTPIPRTSGADGDLQLTPSLAGDTVYAAYDQVAGKGSGIYTEGFGGTRWSGHTRITAGKNKYVDSLAVTPKNAKPVVSYYALR